MVTFSWVFCLVLRQLWFSFLEQSVMTSWAPPKACTCIYSLSEEPLEDLPAQFCFLGLELLG